MHAACVCLLVLTKTRVAVFVFLSGPLRPQSTSLFTVVFLCVSFELSYSSAWKSFFICLIGVLCCRAPAHDFVTLIYLLGHEFC